MPKRGIELGDVLVRPNGLPIAGYTLSFRRGADTNFHLHTFPETTRNSGRVDTGNNAVVGRRTGSTLPMIEVPAISPTESPASGGALNKSMLTGPASSPLNQFYGSLRLPKKLG